MASRQGLSNLESDLQMTYLHGFQALQQASWQFVFAQNSLYASMARAH